jgi:hypothetical protein
VRSHRTLFIAATGLVLVAATLVGWRLLGSAAVRHRDGDGPLISGVGGTSMAFPAGAVGPWSLGIPLCLTTAGPAIIDSVAPTRQLGTGARFLGAVIRTFTRSSSDTMIISIHGFPPAEVPDMLSPAVGAQVSIACGPLGAGDDPSAPITELLVGFTVDGNSGGGWEGVDIGYSIGSTHHILEVGETIVRCGSGVDPGLCGPPLPSPST